MAAHATLKTASGLNPKIASRNVQVWNSLLDHLEDNALGMFALRRVISEMYPRLGSKLHDLYGNLYSHFQVFAFLFPSPLCEVCGVATSRVTCSSRCTYFHKTGYWNPSSNPEIVAKKEATTAKNWGVKNPFQSKVLTKKAQDTRESRTGYRHARQNPAIDLRAEKKRLKTMTDRYGTTNAIDVPGAKERRVSSYIENFGVEHPMKSAEISARMIKTREERCLAKHGVRHILQTPAGLEAHMRALRAVTSHVFKGRKFEVQSSYEKLIFEKLAAKYGIMGVHTQFHREFPKHTFKECGTTPDLYVPSLDQFVEIKSVYTLMYKKEWLRSNRRKAWNCNHSHCQTKWVVVTDPKKGLFVPLPRDWFKLSDTDLRKLVG